MHTRLQKTSSLQMHKDMINVQKYACKFKKILIGFFVATNAPPAGLDRVKSNEFDQLSDMKTGRQNAKQSDNFHRILKFVSCK
jgi:hypothetical protein